MYNNRKSGGFITKQIDYKLVETFLHSVYKSIEKGECDFARYRKVNINGVFISHMQCLIDLGITKEKEIWNYIKTLKPQDCIDVSFERDKTRDENSEMFEFITTVNKQKTYIKLYMNTTHVICLSFHKSKEVKL